MGKGGFGLTFRKILLLLWKNLILRRRHYVVTAFEIILPTIFAILMAYLKAETDLAATGEYKGNSNITVFQEFSELEIISQILTNNDNEACIPLTIMAYAPSNDITDKIMKGIRTEYLSYPTFCNGIILPIIITHPFDTEEEVEAFNTQLGLADWEIYNSFKYAIIFTEGFEDDDAADVVAYKIRRVDLGIETGSLMPWFPTPGPNLEPDRQPRYLERGFLGLQILLDKVIIKHLTGETVNHNYSTQAFPYPPFVNFNFANLYNVLLPQFLVQGFIFMVPSILRGVVSEKETGIKELMKMMGLPNWLHWVGWMLNSLIVLLVSITIVVVLFFIPFNSESGAVIQYSDPSVWWVVLLLYVISASSFCFFVSAFFHKATLATTVGIVLWLVTYYAVAFPLEPQYESLNLATKLTISMLPNMALHYCIKIMSGYEGQGVGAQWKNIGRSVSSVDSLCLWHMFVIFIVNTVFYISLTIYIENVLPSKFGLRKPWYYIFQPSEWGWKSKSNQNLASLRNHSENIDRPGFEKEPSNLKVGIDVRQLRKEFGQHKVAVEDVTIKMFDGDITALLGHNGCGKTTTISILTGMFAATSGTAFVNGFDIKTDMEKVRENLGLCPQHNMLFNKLTVEEHLRFFGMLKGKSGEKAKEEIIDILNKLQLTDKKDNVSTALSGGQKRKLSLACALIGDTKVVYLDEPSSGMDLESRRALWDVLLELRGHRTIVLTTHFMEEADVLGDRIAIMADGKIQCCGSPMFLKKYYGTGYTLKLDLTSGSDANKILRTVQRHIESAQFKGDQGKLSEIAISLPAESNSQSCYPNLFSDLNSNKEKLGIKTVGLSLTTMDEVFVKVGELNHHAKVERNPKDPTVTDAETWGSRDNLSNDKAKGLDLTVQQFYGLFIKKFVYTLRKKRLFISQFIFPVALVIAAILISNDILTPNVRYPPRVITLSDYYDPTTLYASNSSEVFESIFESVVDDTGIKVNDVSEELLRVADRDLGLFRERYVIAAEINSTHMKGMHSTIPIHSSPLIINVMSNTLLKNLAPGTRYSIEATNHPLRSGRREIYDAIVPNPQYSETVPILFAVFMPIGLSLLAASYIVFPIEERQCKAKQIQLMTGTSPMIYWGSSFVWDYFFMLIVICLMTACFPIFEKYRTFSSHGGAVTAFLILLVYGLGAIPFSYLLSLYTESVAGGFSIVTIFHITTGMIINLVVYGLNTSEKQHIGKVIAWFGRLFPTFGAAISTMHYTKTATINSRCNILNDRFKEVICTPEVSNVTGGTLIQQCCENCKELDVACFEPLPFIEWENYDSSLDLTVPGIGQELLYMLIMALVYTTFLILVEYGVFRRLRAAFYKVEEFNFHSDSGDEDVKMEKQRVQQLITSGRVSEDALVVENLCKSFGSFSAVSKLSFGVHHGECFGLLGVNGAGKTTSFRMLTGDEVVSSGNAYALINTLKENRKDFLSNIGYCPQFDGIIGVLTGREMLELFSRLRGIPSGSVKSEARMWLTKMGLIESADIECQRYSGGMKRRLSAAMAMVGDPPVLMLDEISTGVDPVARRELWKCIASSASVGQAIILTSHSMEECEALCSRLCIMVNGEMQCIGGVEHLKNKFAQGFCLYIKLKYLKATDEERLKALNNQILREFDPCVLKDQHQNVLQYQISNTELPWDVLFKQMENIKQNYIHFLEEYSVRQTTLEEVFLSFARMQYPERKVDISLFKKVLACKFCSCNGR